MDPLPQTALPSQTRRNLVLAVGAGAAVAGVSLAVWRSAHVSTPVAEPCVGFWDQQWTTTEDKMLPMAGFRGKPLLINFWATWCAPCVEELPIVDAFFKAQQQSGWQVLGLAADKPRNVQDFLQKMPLDFPVVVDAMLATQWARQLGNIAGGLPFSVVINSAGEVAQRKMGKLTAADLAAWSAIK